MSLSLTEIANEEATDKGTSGPVENYGHNYTDLYDIFLAPVRDEPITLLEIGLGVTGPNWDTTMVHGRNTRGGASMRMWYRYFPKARILGVDLNPAAFLDNDRITTGVVDQSDPKQLRAFLARVGVQRLDVVIDDGSHRPDHQQTSLSALFPYVAPGDLYVIEDLLDNGRGDARNDRHSCVDVLSTRRVLRHFAQTGEFPAHNALENPDELARSIARVSFHAPNLLRHRFPPLQRVKEAGRILVTGEQSVVGWRFSQPGTEQICAIRKV